VIRHRGLRWAFPVTVLLHLPAEQESLGLPKFFDVSLPACHGLRTPADLPILANADGLVLPSGAQAVPRPWRPETPATPSSPILSRLSRARKAAPRLAARRFRTQPPRAGGAAGAARGPRPPAQTGGGSGEVKNAVSFSYPCSATRLGTCPTGTMSHDCASARCGRYATNKLLLGIRGADPHSGHQWRSVDAPSSNRQSLVGRQKPHERGHPPVETPILLDRQPRPSQDDDRRGFHRRESQWTSSQALGALSPAGSRKGCPSHTDEFRTVCKTSITH
jgi:hypothetical protein